MLVIRFFRVGKKNQPSFKIVVTDKRKPPRAGRYIEEVGFWNPVTKEKVLKKDRILYWISVGAKPSPTVFNLFVSEKIIEGKKIDVHKKAKEKKEKPKEEKPKEKPKKEEKPKEVKPKEPAVADSASVAKATSAKEAAMADKEKPAPASAEASAGKEEKPKEKQEKETASQIGEGSGEPSGSPV